MFSRFFTRKKPARRSKISYEDAKVLARDPDEDTRIDLADRTDLRPEILYFLAEDPSPRVRSRIAANTTAPHQADMLLAADENEGVRETLVEKIVRVSPGLDEETRTKLRQRTYEALSLLAKDQAVRIRQTIAEALKEVADAPPDVIRRLAWDVEAAVSTPVLRFSPVLTDNDLIEIIKAKPSPGSISAISQRDRVSEPVSDAIVDSDDFEGIAILLRNESAQIREETLDRILDHAADVELLHMPLAMRPKLPSKVAVKIARFVAEDILKRMVAREDLDAKSLQAVREVVHRRLGDAEAVQTADTLPHTMIDAGVKVDDDDAFDWASKLWAKGELNESKLLETIGEDRKRAMAVLAVMADLPLRVIERAVMHKSAKGCIALAWRAGLTPGTAELLQFKLAHIPMRNVLKSENGRLPLDEDELKWQIDFMNKL